MLGGALILAIALTLFITPASRAQEEQPDAAPAVEQPTEPSLVNRLRQGGYVIYLRHASTDFSQADSDLVNLQNCATQRNLTDVGRDQASAMGEAIGALGVPIGDVLSSEFCRTLETAQLAFGRAIPTRELTSISGLTIAERDPPTDATNTVLVAHQFNLRDAMGVTLVTEGEAAVYQPDGTGGTALTALVMPYEWKEFLQQ